MSLTKFIEFIRLEESGKCWDDPTYRAYDLDRRVGETATKRARRALGYSSFGELRSDIVGMGYLGPIVGPLARWYIWERIRTGELRTWYLRKGRREPKPAPPSAT